ncbi:unnamed protein product [Heligmosomoides polygyrus]|uniref:DUF982 domain-containing protein n=1 Tax=Heligmosomoides polygyrus TaxID=6339 RepID=A0A183FD00_HELPZ|nr:unnamed protein product [Heligmosomoides polygyrus]
MADDDDADRLLFYQCTVVWWILVSRRDRGWAVAALDAGEKWRREGANSPHTKSLTLAQKLESASRIALQGDIDVKLQMH